MKKLIKLMALIVLMTMATGITAYAKGAPQKIKVIVNENTVKLHGSPYIKNGEVMIPARQTIEALGGDVKWDRREKTAWIHLGMMHVELIIGKSEIYIHRDADFSGIPQTVKLNTPVSFVHGKVYIPGKIILENMGMIVTWDHTKKVLSITDNTKLSSLKFTEVSTTELGKRKEVTTWFNQNYQKLGVFSLKQDNVMYVLVAAGKKPTGGYTVGINNITMESSKNAYVSAYVKSPSPDMMVIQVETYPYILVKIEDRNTLKSVSGEIQPITYNGLPTTVPYDEISYDNVKDNYKVANWYNENYKKLGINYFKDGNYIYALIGGGERPTGGFTVKIDQIYYSSSDTVTIHAKVTPPGDNVRVMMMITYPYTLIRIKSEQVTKVVGDVVDETAKEKWITMDATTVSKMELYNLTQVKLRDLIQLEKDTVIKAFNQATIDQSSYIEMITGNLLRVTLYDGYVVIFTSYGSQTNVIANITKDGDNTTFHLVAPDIAKLLLRK